MIVKLMAHVAALSDEFESSVNSYDSQTNVIISNNYVSFESSVNSYDSQTNTGVNANIVSLRVV